MQLSDLTDDQKLELYEHIQKKYPWAQKKENIKRLAQTEISTGRKVF